MMRAPNDDRWPSRGLRQSALFIIINFHCEDDVEGLVRDLDNQHEAESIRIVVVDNGAIREPDKRLTDLADGNPRLRVLVSGQNLGYFGGAAWGLQLASEGRRRLPDWVVIANPDIRVPMREFLSRLYNLYAADPPAVVAPAVRSHRDVEQRLFMQQRPTTVRMHFYKWMFRQYGTCVGYNLLAIAKRAVQDAWREAVGDKLFETRVEPFRIYAPHGSFILFNRSYFEAGGTLRHGTFLFGEEVSVGEQVAQLGKAVIYEPRLSVRHEGGKTTGILRNRAVAMYQRESARYLADELFA